MIRASLMAQMVKNMPAMQETQVQSMGWEDPLEKGLTTHSSILAWRIPRTKESGGLQCMGSQRVGYDWATNTHTHTHTQEMIIAYKESPHHELLFEAVKTWVVFTICSLTWLFLPPHFHLTHRHTHMHSLSSLFLCSSSHFLPLLPTEEWWKIVLR